MHTLEQLRSGALCGARHLKLRENLTCFPPEILMLKETLEVLDLTGNQLAELPDALAEFPRLRILFCSENRFTRLPEVLGRCPALTMIGFKANRIREVPAAALPLNLRWLVLTDNEIAALPDALGQCRGLQKLMLAGNRLTGLPQTLADCRQLELVRLSANRLTRLPAWLLALPRLSWLAFAGNPCCASPQPTVAVRAVPWASLTPGKVLGEGASGRIVAADWQQGEGVQPVAVKLFKGAVTSDGLPHCEKAAALAAGRHPALIELIGEISDHPAGVEALVMALIDPDYATLAGPPSLASCTRDVYEDGLRLTPDAVLGIAQKLAAVAAHLHGLGILHGDLYAHNILQNGQGGALLGDFGAASCYGPASPLGPALERLEVRAFGCLLEELIELGDVTAELRQALEMLMHDCLGSVPAIRPDFAQVQARLMGLSG
ncbi:leucine-rich repeat-containing protein kinase family protein [Pseudaeromonas sp. ZJS20]|uniref:leucine-rich repeat-containing protein kinase family protein n=1 Tax=Pseudaeromonas aegiceratis TaxID=3153928 RepID=UPI00390C8AD3